MQLKPWKTKMFHKIYIISRLQLSYSCIIHVWHKTNNIRSTINIYYRWLFYYTYIVFLIEMWHRRLDKLMLTFKLGTQYPIQIKWAQNTQTRTKWTQYPIQIKWAQNTQTRTKWTVIWFVYCVFIFIQIL
jgi:hypothetical protein